MLRTPVADLRAAQSRDVGCTGSRLLAFTALVLSLSFCKMANAQENASSTDPIVAQLGSGDAGQIAAAVLSVRSMLNGDAGGAVNRLNENWMQSLLQAKQYAAVDEFAVTGVLAVPADTWRVEQLQRHRVRAMLAQGKAKEALAAAKAEFLVSSLSQTAHDLDLLTECLAAAHPDDPGIAARFKLQQLSGAQAPEGNRWKDRSPEWEKKQLLKHGESILAKIEVDPKPWEKAISQYEGKTDFKSLTARGNLLLLCGRVKEAKEALTHAYEVAPAGEIRFASEGLAKAIKAEDCALGRANAFVLSIRPE